MKMNRRYQYISELHSKCWNPSIMFYKQARKSSPKYASTPEIANIWQQAMHCISLHSTPTEQTEVKFNQNLPFLSKKTHFYFPSKLKSILPMCVSINVNFYHSQSAMVMILSCVNFTMKISLIILLLPDFIVTFRLRQDGWHLADDILKCIFLNENVWILIEISLKFVPMGPIDNTRTLGHIMACHQTGDKPLSEPMVI